MSESAAGTCGVHAASDAVAEADRAVAVAAAVAVVAGGAGGGGRRRLSAGAAA